MMDSYSEINEKIFAFGRSQKLSSALQLHRFSRIWTLFMLATADFFSLTASVWLALSMFDLIGLEWAGFDYFGMGLLLSVFAGMFILVGLYRLRGTNQVEELRLLTVTTTMIFAFLYAFNGLMAESSYPTSFFALSWSFAIVFFPLTRAVVRRLGSSIGIWGEPVVIMGNGKLSRRITQFLLKNSYCGMRPVMVVDASASDTTASAAADLPKRTIPLEEWSSTSAYASKLGVRTAIVVAPELPSSVSDSIASGEHLGFSNIITVTEQFNTRNAGLIPLDLGGILGLEERHYELNAIESWQIRILDLLLIFLSLPVLVPLFLCIVAAIKLDSKGSAFYRQRRIGKGGREFEIIKFRTMVNNADEVLAKHLQENRRLFAEWKANHKLKDDPRITRMGNILRKTSLDELPQLWNVIKGDMSLVGPRPIVTAEIVRYGDRFKYYTQVPPGITGLWQVSGRNDVGYQQRVRLDEYYVRNRSIWINLHILVRTASAVIRQHGAY